MHCHCRAFRRHLGNLLA